MKYCAEDLFRFSGRITRTRFALQYSIFLIVGFFVLKFLIVGVSFAQGLLATILALLFFVGMISLLVGMLSIHIRRLHDMGCPGWFVLFPILYVLVLAMAAFFGMGAGFLISAQQVYSSSVGAVLFIPLNLFTTWICLLPGTSGENHFGEDPRGRKTVLEDLYKRLYEEFFSFSGKIGRMFFLKGILACIFLFEVLWRGGIQIFFSGTGSFFENLALLFSESPSLFLINATVSLVAVSLFLISITSLLVRRIADLRLPRWSILTFIPILIIYFSPQFSQYFMLIWWLYIFLFAWKKGEKDQES